MLKQMEPLPTDEVRKRIISNLEGRVYGISLMAAVHGVDDIHQGIEMIHRLVAEGSIKTNLSSAGPYKMVMYRYVPKLRPKLTLMQ